MPPQKQPPYAPVPPPAPQTPAPANQYEFIMNPGQPKRRPLLPKSPKSLLLIVGIAAVVVVLLAIIFAAFSGGNKSAAPFVRVAQEQTEIGRVAALQYDVLKQEKTKQFADNTKLTMQTDQSRLVSLLAKQGVRISDKQLALGARAATDTELSQAVATSSLDAVLTKELQTELQAYKQSLQQAYTATSSSSLQSLLRQLNGNADLLLTQSKASI